MDWLSSLWDAIPSVWKVVSALVGLGGLIAAAYWKGERFLQWVQKKLYGKGGLRIVKAIQKGHWRVLNDSTLRLSSDWYASSLLPRSVRILTVHMERPLKIDGELIPRSVVAGETAEVLGIQAPPDKTVLFEARFDIPIKYKSTADLRGKIVFTDHFNNSHPKSVTFSCE